MVSNLIYLLNEATKLTRQRNQFLILMQHFNETLKEQQTQSDSAGNAMKRYQDYANSTKAKIDDLKNSVQKMWLSLINSSTINSFVSGANKIVNGLNMIINSSTKTKVMLIATSIAVVLAIKNIGSAILNVANTSEKLTLVDGMLKVLFGSAASGTTIIKGLTSAVDTLRLALNALFMTKAGLGILIATAAVAALTVAVTHHIQKERELKKETDDVAKSYKDLTAAIKENNAEQIKSDSATLSSEQYQLQNAIKAKEQAEQIKNEAEKLQQQGFSGAKLTEEWKKLYGSQHDYVTDTSNATKAINTSSEAISKITGILKQNGIAFDSTTGEIYKFTEAQMQLRNNNTADKIRKDTQAEYDNRSELARLGNEYLKLNSAQNLNNQQKERMSTLANELASRIDGLSVATDKNGNSTITNTGTLQKEIGIMQTEGETVDDITNKKLEEAKQSAKLQDMETEITYKDATKRIEMIKEEIQALDDLMKAQSDVSGYMSSEENAENELQNAKTQQDREKAQQDINEAKRGFVLNQHARSEENARKGAASSELSDLQSELDKINEIYKGTGDNTPPSDTSGDYTPSGDSSKAQEKAEKAEESAEEEARKKARKRLEIEKSEIEAEKQARLQALKESFEVEKQEQEDIIKNYQAELTALERKKQLTDDNNELLKDQNALVKAQKELEFAKENTDVRMLTASGWQWVADFQAVQSAQEKVNEAQDTLNQKKEDVDYQQQENTLNDKIKSAQDKESQIESTYQNKQENMENSYSARTNAIENQENGIEGYATGIDSVPIDQIATVGEEGAELVVSPTLAKLQQGTQVINAEDTSKIINGGNVNETSYNEGKAVSQNFGNGVSTNSIKAIKPVNDIIAVIEDNLANLAEDCINYGKLNNKNYGQAITDTNKTVTKPIADIISSIINDVNKLITDSITYGRSTDKNYAQGITDNNKTVNDSVDIVTKSVGKQFSDFVNSCLDYGKGVDSELTKGIKDEGEGKALNDAVNDLTNKVVDTFKQNFGIHSPSTVMYSIGDYLMQGLINGMSNQDIESFIKNKVVTAKNAAIDGSKVNLSGDVKQWVTLALSMSGTSLSWLPGMLQMISKESGGDPTEVNGEPVGNEHATGLAQMLPSTFQEYMAAGHNQIFSPIDNLLASIKYIKSRYGDVMNIPNLFSGNYVGYATGGEVQQDNGLIMKDENGRELELAHQGNHIINHNDTEALMNMAHTYTQFNGELQRLLYHMPDVNVNVPKSTGQTTKYSFNIDRVVLPENTHNAMEVANVLINIAHTS